MMILCTIAIAMHKSIGVYCGHATVWAHVYAMHYHAASINPMR